MQRYNIIYDFGFTILDFLIGGLRGEHIRIRNMAFLTCLYLKRNLILHINNNYYFCADLSTNKRQKWLH